MDDRLTTILEDLYRLDPTLRGEEEVVRALVATLLKEKPIVAPDPAFVTRLRSELVTSSAGKAKSGSVASPWWMSYVAPIGALALLLIILVPKYVVSPTATEVTPALTPASTSEVTEETLLESAPFEVSAPAADMEMKTKLRSFGANETGAGGSESFMMTDVPEGPIDIFYVNTQKPGLQVMVEYAELSAPGFLVIYAGEPNDSVQIGVSKLILPGYLEPFVVPLTFPMTRETTYFAAIYHDDADTVFNPEKDILVFDAGGQPLYQWFSTEPWLP